MLCWFFKTPMNHLLLNSAGGDDARRRLTFVIQCNSIMFRFMKEDWILFSMSKCRVIFGGWGEEGLFFLSCMVCIHAKLLFLLSTSKKKRLTWLGCHCLAMYTTGVNVINWDADRQEWIMMAQVIRGLWTAALGLGKARNLPWAPHLGLLQWCLVQKLTQSN